MWRVGRGPPEADDPDIEVATERDQVLPAAVQCPRARSPRPTSRRGPLRPGRPGSRWRRAGVQEVALVVDDDQSRRLREVTRCHIEAGLDRRHEALQRSGHHRALVADVTDSPPRRRRPGPSLATFSQPALAGRRRVENQRSRSGPWNSVRRTTSAGVALGAEPAGEGVSSPATVPPVLRRNHPSSDQRTCCRAVSRPRVDRWSGPIGRAQRWATYHSPSGVLTREPWPAFCSSAPGLNHSSLRWSGSPRPGMLAGLLVRNGLSGSAS